MTDDIATALKRIERALARIEHAAATRPAARADDESEQRYQRLRSRTQAALAELDTVIARVSRRELA